MMLGDDVGISEQYPDDMYSLGATCKLINNVSLVSAVVYSQNGTVSAVPYRVYPTPRPM